MSVPHRRFNSRQKPPDTKQRRTVVIGEEDGYTYVTIKTEVTIVIHDADDLEALDLADMLPPARTLLRSLRRAPDPSRSTD